MISMVESCAVFMGHSAPIMVIDLVCGMKVDKSEAYEWKCDGVKYYFDTYNCKETFKMNPEKFLKNKCTEMKRK